jgi:hypothetical protein
MKHQFKIGDKFARKSDPKKCIGVVMKFDAHSVTTNDFCIYGVANIVKVAANATVGDAARYTNEQMSQCFANVQNAKGWKHRINKLIDNPGEKNLDCLAEAILNFTGSMPTFFNESNGKVRVMAEGYYAAIGA